jgi:prepilin-type processing-associated H-X9-DG protein
MARSYGPKAKVDRISCINNLKMIGIAYHLWAEDHNGHFPASESVTNEGWRELLTDANQGFRCWTNYAMMADEMGQSAMVVVCPSDERRPAANFSNTFSNTNLSYFVGVSANGTQPQSLLAGDRNLGDGPEPDRDYGFSPGTGQGNDVAIQSNSKAGPVCWSLKMHSQGKSDGTGNILLADGSVQQVSSRSFRSDWQGVAGQTTNWPVGKVPAAASVRVLFP